MRPPVPLTLLIVWLSTLPAACSTVAPPARVAELADQAIDAMVASAGFSGAVVLMRDGQVLHQRAVGFARRDPELPFTLATASDGASIAKTLTAAAVLQLRDEGRLALDDPVQRHVREYPHAATTLRHLLAHRAGLPDYESFDADFAPGQVRSTTALLKVIAQRGLPPAFEPGSRFEYSSLGFDAAALAVERISGQRLDAWMRERYFERFSMRDIFLRPARFADWPGPRTLGYRRNGEDWTPFDVFDDEGFYGGSNFYASAMDWARWAAAFADGRVMPAARLDAGSREALLDSGLSSSLNLLGWYCEADRQRCYCSGDLNSFYNLVYWDRARREVVVYVSNSTLAPRQRAPLARALIAALAGQAPPPAAAPALATFDDDELAPLAGRYLAPGLGTMILSVRDEQVHLRVGAGTEVAVWRVGRTAYYTPGLDLWLAFSGEPEPHTLHIRSVFHEASAPRQSPARAAP